MHVIHQNKRYTGQSTEDGVKGTVKIERDVI